MHLTIVAIHCGIACVLGDVMRKTQKVSEVVDAFGNAVPASLHEIGDHIFASVDALGQVQLDSEPIENVAGPVAEALRQAKAELAAQITEQKKAKEDTDIALNRAKTDKTTKEEELATTEKWIEHYTKLAQELKQTIQKHSEKIDELSKLSSSQQAEIDRLTAAHDAKHSASQVAEDLEKLIDSLNDQIKKKQTIKANALATHAKEIAKLDHECTAKTKEYDSRIQGLTAAIAEAKKELDLLSQVHTEDTCDAKESKFEMICKRCSSDQQPCGDKCISASEACFHDKGCACKSSSSSFIQLSEPSENEGHPLQDKLNNAKAEIRKIIAQHKKTIDSLHASLTVNEQEANKLARAKDKAMSDYNIALKALEKQRAELSASHKAASQSKTEAEAKLESTTAEGLGAIKTLTTQLQKQMAALEAERKSTEEARVRQITTCKETRKAQLDAHAEVVGGLDAELAQLDQELNDAQAKLDQVKHHHGIAKTTTAEPTSKPTEAPTTVAPTQKPTSQPKPSSSMMTPPSSKSKSKLVEVKEPSKIDQKKIEQAGKKKSTTMRSHVDEDQFNDDDFFDFDKF